jgi:hypothetical protein
MEIPLSKTRLADLLARAAPSLEYDRPIFFQVLIEPQSRPVSG